MNWSIAPLLVGLVIVIVIQTIHRLAGSIALLVWCAGVLAYGLLAFERGEELLFFGIEAKRWNFIAFMAVMVTYNLVVIARALLARRSTPPDAKSDSAPHPRPRTDVPD